MGNASSRIVRKQCEEKSEKKLKKGENKSSRIDLFVQKKNLVSTYNFKISSLCCHPQLVTPSGVEWTIQHVQTRARESQGPLAEDLKI